METLQKEFANLIITRRKELKVRQEELSALTQVALRTIRDMEKGVGNPSLQTIHQVMQILGIELVFRLRK
jgi:transcriptional regulator with XRE-family HTH domain